MKHAPFSWQIFVISRVQVGFFVCLLCVSEGPCSVQLNGRLKFQQIFRLTDENDVFCTLTSAANFASQGPSPFTPAQNFADYDQLSEHNYCAWQLSIHFIKSKWLIAPQFPWAVFDFSWAFFFWFFKGSRIHQSD